MTDRQHELRVTARTAQLQADAEDNTAVFSGIAVAPGDILHMDDGTPVLFTEEALRQAAETQAGEKLTVDHPSDDDGRPAYPPPVEETVGTVAKAGYIDGRGVGYEATTHDDTIAEGVQGGTYEVSVHPEFTLGEQDEATGAYVAENVRFLDLSVVSMGDSPNNTATWGPSQELAAWATRTDVGAELTAGEGAGNSAGSQDGTVASAVRGTLRAIGFDIDSLGADSTATTTMAAESAADNDSSETEDTPMNDRDTTIQTLVDDHGFAEDSLASMADDDLERVAESVDDSTDGGSTDTKPSGATDGGDGQTDTGLDGMTVDDLGDALREQGFVTEADADDIVEEANAQASKAEQVDEIIASSDAFDENDREDLMASSASLIEREHERATGSLGASLPGTTGARDSARASRSDDGDPLDVYGTGVEGR